MDTNLFGAAVCGLDLHIAVPADRFIELRDLVVLGIIGVKIVFTVKFTVLVNGAVRGKSHSRRIFYHLFVQHRK